MCIQNKLGCLPWQVMKHTSLVGLFVSYEENEVLLIQSVWPYSQNFFSLEFMYRQNKLGCLSWKVMKHTSLVGPFVSYEENEVL
jgi:hypothetical protein